MLLHVIDSSQSIKVNIGPFWLLCLSVTMPPSDSHIHIAIGAAVTESTPAPPLLHLHNEVRHGIRWWLCPFSLKLWFIDGDTGTHIWRLDMPNVVRMLHVHSVTHDGKGEHKNPKSNKK